MTDPWPSQIHHCLPGDTWEETQSWHRETHSSQSSSVTRSQRERSRHSLASFLLLQSCQSAPGLHPQPPHLCLAARVPSLGPGHLCLSYISPEQMLIPGQIWKPFQVKTLQLVVQVLRCGLRRLKVHQNLLKVETEIQSQAPPQRQEKFSLMPAAGLRVLSNEGRGPSYQRSCSARSPPTKQSLKYTTFSSASTSSSQTSGLQECWAMVRNNFFVFSVQSIILFRKYNFKNSNIKYSFIGN